MRYILFCILLLKGEKIYELFLSEVFRTAASSIGDGDTRSILISFLAISIPLSIGWIKFLGDYILTNIFETILLLISWMRAFIWNRKKAPRRVILRKTGSRWYNTLGRFPRIWLIRMLSFMNTAISRKVVGKKMCTRQSWKIIWDMINTLFLSLKPFISVTRKLTNGDQVQCKMKRFINTVLLCYMKGKANSINLFSQTCKPWSLHYRVIFRHSSCH